MEWSGLYLFCINLSWSIDISVSLTFLPTRNSHHTTPYGNYIGIYDIDINVVKYTSRTVAVQWRLTPAELNPTFGRTYENTAKTATTTTNRLASAAKKIAIGVPNTGRRVFHGRLTYQVQYCPKMRPEDVHTISTKQNQIILEQLIPGELYRIALRLLTNNHSQELIVIEQRTRPTLGLSTLSEMLTTPTTVTAAYTQPGGDGVFDRYVFSVGDNIPSVEKMPDDPERVVQFTELVPGTMYTLYMWVQSGPELSSPRSLEILTNPLAPSVRCGLLTSHTFELIIDRPRDGRVDKYDIICAACRLNITVTKDASATRTKHVIGKLKPFTEYRYEVKSVREADDGLRKESVVVDGACKTTIGPPGPVELFEVTDIKPYQVTLEWRRPKEANGIIRGYTIRYSGTKPNKRPETTKTKIINVPNLRTSNVTDLKAGFKYTFQIYARNGLNGMKTNMTITLPIDPPALDPERNVEPNIIDSGAVRGVQWNKVALNFTNPYTNKNGDVVNYSIIVAETKRNNPEFTFDVTESWYAAYKQDPSPPYAAIYKCEDLFKKGHGCLDVSAPENGHNRSSGSADSVQIVIGGDTSCDADKVITGSYCNGPLRQSTRYMVFLRGYNEEDEFTDAAAVVIFTAKKPVPVAVIVPVLLVIITAVTLAVVLVLWRLGFILKNDKSKKSDTVKLAMDLRRTRASRPVKIIEFAEHFKQMSADSDFKFAEEYENLKPVGRDQPYEVAQLACNRAKNRYVNILPYDHSRVKLLARDDEEGCTDYINASWMPGYNSKREFIACQGPLPATRDDHWRMIWECNCRAIIMLANCVESGRDKCDHYWPHDREPRKYGDIQVQIVEEELDSSRADPEYAITYMTMSYGDQLRPIIHYHYLVWPDFGVPENPKSLVSFVKKVRGGLNYKGGPIVVHCSAGVGRTGTFITLDRLFQTIEEHDIVDIYGIVHEMRLNRPFMVQSERQYIFIHACLKYELDARGLCNEAYDDADEDEPRPMNGNAGIEIIIDSASCSERDDQSDDSTFQLCTLTRDQPPPIPEI